MISAVATSAGVVSALFAWLALVGSEAARSRDAERLYRRESAGEPTTPHDPVGAVGIRSTDAQYLVIERVRPAAVRFV